LHHPFSPGRIAVQESLANYFRCAGLLFNEALERLEVKLEVAACTRRPSAAASPSIMGMSKRSAAVAEWLSKPSFTASGSGCGWGSVLS